MRPTPIQPILYLPNSAMLNLPLTIRVALQSGTEAVAYLPKAGNALPAAWVDARASQEARNGRSSGQQRVPDPRQHEGVGVGQSGTAFLYGKAGAAAGPGRSAGARRRGGDLRHRP